LDSCVRFGHRASRGPGPSVWSDEGPGLYLPACQTARLQLGNVPLGPARDRTFCRLLGTVSFGAHPGLSSRHFSIARWMAQPPQKHRLSRSRRRALELLASSPDGATKESLVLVHGIDRDTIAGLVRTGLATARNEAVKAGGKTISSKRYRITNAGRMALEGWPRLIRPPR
jgi:hypothetical protein